MKEQQENKICRKCVFYRQHYVFTGGAYHWAYLGHCTQGRLKPRRPDAKACELYNEMPRDKK